MSLHSYRNKLSLFPSGEFRVSKHTFEMNKLISANTFLFKQAIPTIAYVFLAGIALIGLYAIATGSFIMGIVLLIFPIPAVLIVNTVFKKVLSDLVDEVYDEGSSLRIVNGVNEVRVNLGDIEDVHYSTASNPPRVTLNLLNETVLGRDLVFAPPRGIVPFRKNKDIVDLIARIRKCRANQPLQ